MATPVVRASPRPAITALIGRLTDDSKRLIRDEVRLAKLELGESVRDASRGGLWLALAFGIGVIALVGLTVLLTALIGHTLIGKTWAGALITGALELAVGAWLVWRGRQVLSRTDFTFGGSRAELRETVTRLRGR